MILCDYVSVPHVVNILTCTHAYPLSITLILVASSDASTDAHFSYLLDLVFNAMVLLVGLHELETITNVERLKQDIRVDTRVGHRGRH